MWKRLTSISALVLLITATGAFLYSDCLSLFSLPMGLSAVAREISLICHAPATQWMVIACLSVYLCVFLFLERRTNRAHRIQFGNANLWLGTFVFAIVLRHTLGETGIHSEQTVILLSGVVLGKAVTIRILGKDKAGKTDSLRMWLLCIGLLLLAGTIAPSAGREFRYHGLMRWSSAWSNPNLYGLLMAVGLVLSSGFLIRDFGRKHWWLFPVIGAAGLYGAGLFKSYSRGAWVAAAFGIVYLVSRVLPSQKSKAEYCDISWRHPKWRFFSVILIFLPVLAFWQFRFTEWAPARRLFSAVNVNDFSWRNRVTAWQGAMRMMGERPWIGHGLGNAESVYEEKFRPPQLDNGAAIQMNDFLALGASAGVPALICFLVYVGLSLRNPRPTVHIPQLPRGPDSGTEVSEFQDLAWLQATCRAGAIVLLVGFFFDGGLFKLATGSVFWILLELGRVDRYRGGAEAQRVPDPATEIAGPKSTELSLAPADKMNPPEPALPRKLAPWEIWLRRAAWVLGIAAVSESAILLATPFFGVNNTTLAISRHYLVPPSAVADLNLLATNVDWSSRKLRPLLQHASLANYNRQLINWKLDDAIYHDYVLDPSIDPARDGQLAWRRKLWEYFYLPMRKENDPASAAQIVLKFLHQRIATVPVGPATIEQMWRAKQADEKGIQALEVAAFRSVGIPARLNSDGHAELFSDGKWQALPEYTQPAPESAGRK